MTTPTDKATCADKAAFPSKRMAEAARVQQKFFRGNAHLRSYHCRRCGLYHLASDY